MAMETASVEHREHVGHQESVAGLVLGILSLFFAWLPVIGLACSILGLVMAIKGRKMCAAVSFHRAGTAGEVCSIIGLVLSSFCTLLWLNAIINGAPLTYLPYQMTT